jgi:hypothetical protein
LRFRLLLCGVLCVAAVQAQNALGPADAFQLRYVVHLNIGDSLLTFLNSGTASALGGTICVNLYATTPDEQMMGCCGCVLTPNALASLSARNAFPMGGLTPSVPTAFTFLLIATSVAGRSTCNPSVVSPLQLAPGLRAWATTLHAVSPNNYQVSETAFAQASLSAAQLARLTGLCGFIQANGSGFGICRGCTLGSQ